jgi:hydrogenase maturation protease
MSRLVIGVGNPLRGDDGVGAAVVTQLRWAAADHSLSGSFELLDMWADHDDVVVVDAMVSTEPAGTIRVFDAAASPLPRGTLTSTHGVGIAETIELGRRLGVLPDRLTVYGIAVGDVDDGCHLSPPVAAAAAAVASEVDRA